MVVSSQAKFNLLSLTALMKVGWQLHGDTKNLVLTKDGKQLKFNHTVRTQKGMLFVIRIKRTLSEELATPGIDEARKKYAQVKKKYIKTRRLYKQEKKISKKEKRKQKG